MSQVLHEEEMVILRKAHKLTRDKKVADKIKTVLAISQGYSYEEVAHLFLLDETTISRYVRRFKEEGVEGLMECQYIGGHGMLTLVQEAALKEELQTNTRQGVGEIRQYIQQTYGVSYSISGTTKLIHRLGFTYKKPKVIPGKVDMVKQEAFISSYQQIKQQLKENDRVYFVDATHPQHNTTLASGWILKGKANDKYLKTNTGRARLNLNGAYSYTDKQAIVREEQTINTNSTIRLFEEISKRQKNGKIYLILDNARYHHSRQVKNWILNHPRYKLIYLPPYSPNLNIIERLWKYYHKKITYNHYFESFEQFKTASLEFFKNLNQYQEDLHTLMTDNFQLYPKHFLHS
jgi:transposase